MKQIRYLLAMMILSIGVLGTVAGYVSAAPFAFSVDRFQVKGNLPVNAIDEFNDGTSAPWVIDNGTAIEENGMLTLTNPGDIGTGQFGNFFVTHEESDIFLNVASFGVVDGAGDFVVTSIWTTGIPGQNQYFLMESDIETSAHIDLDEIQIGIYNIEPALVGLQLPVTAPAGLSVTFKKRTGSDDILADSQSFFINKDDITGNIILSLSFNDDTNQFTGTFSLDGGNTFQSPFLPIDTRVGEGKFNDWELSAASMSIVETVNLLDYDIVSPVGSWWTYAYTYPLGQDDFTVSIARITSGEYEGLLRRGDYHEYHPSDPKITWMIYDLSGETFTLYEDSGQIFDPPFVFDGDDYKQELECYAGCSVIPFPGVAPVPEAYLRIEDEITVPAGTFHNILVKFSIDREKNLPPNSANYLYGLDPVEVPYAVTHIRWYALGIGLVQCVDINSETGSIVHRYELESYYIPDSDDTPPDKPTLLSPSDGAGDLSLTPTLQTGSFSDPDSGDIHLQTDWQISTVDDFSSDVLFETSTTHLTSMTVPHLTLDKETRYYWRVRFYDNRLQASPWSDTFSFDTRDYEYAGDVTKMYFPHIASNGSWETEICIINPSASQSLYGELKAYNNAGQKLAAKPLHLMPHARGEITVGEKFSNPKEIGYLILESDTENACGYTKFFIDGKYRVAVPSVLDVNTGDIYISHIASSDNWWTGVSLLNTTSSPKTLTIEFNNGQTKTMTLAANEHRAFTIANLFETQPQPDIQSGVITNSNGIIGLELFGSTENSGNNYLSGIVLKDDTTFTIYYPHIASDATWWTGLVAYNPSASATTITITPYSEGGTSLTPQSLPISGHGKYIGTVAGLNLPAGTTWLQIEATSPIAGFELFGTKDENQLAGYTGVGISGKTGVFAKLEKNGWTGIAFVNTGNSTASMLLTAYDNNGNAITTETVGLAGHAKMVDMAPNLFSQDISNATYITYSSDLDVVGFQLNGSPDGMMLDALPGM